jgi:DNA primase
LLTKQLKFVPKQVGRSIFFLCPFHDDRNPSLSFEPQWKILTCFSCGFKAKDIFDFWVQYRKISFEEALSEISQAGLATKIAPLLVKSKWKLKKPDKINALLTLLVDIYQHNLSTFEGREVLNYLYEERQINQELITRFALGCSINNRQISNLLLRSEKTDSSHLDLLTLGLVKVVDNNQTYDFFVGKQLIIPLTNSVGKTVALAARKIRTEAGENKYVYSPNYQGYHKSSLLYNYHQVKKSLALECYLVEGFFDVISLTKSGQENCLALLGTNLSEEQIKLLGDLKKRIIFFLDGDQPGREATVNLTLRLLLRKIDCEVIKFPYEGDPDKLCRCSEPETIKNILSQRENPYLFIINYYFGLWKVAENPQRTNYFIHEMAYLFRQFKPDVHNFLVERISWLTQWNSTEIVAYFQHHNSPSLHSNPHYLLINHYQELINEQEKKIIYLCAQKRTFWLLTKQKNYFFSEKINREQYWTIYNHYTLSPHKSFKQEEASSFPCFLTSLSNFKFWEDLPIDLTREENFSEEQALLIFWASPEKQAQTIDLIFRKITQFKKIISLYQDFA